MCTVIAGAALSSMAGYGAATYAGLSTAATVATVAAAAASGAQAGANYEAAEYNEEVAKQNAQSLLAQSQNEREAGSLEAQKSTIQTRQRTSQAAVEFAGRGLDIGAGGTAEDLLAQSEQMGAIDSMTILGNSYRKALGYEQEARNIVSQAKGEKRKAAWGMGTSVLSSASRPIMMGAI
ncbi:hypothetical protein LCS78_17000 [Vibrio harveyi]|uniref:hypothetical protein n=1 Tax=Vibrio harveyi TaxID=669 RepID=UPI00237FC9C1|nr:hypothetical protein [Vibrio harveyi]HDM8068677.1 hypothetical protein [Vibrio harveyi]